MAYFLANCILYISRYFFIMFMNDITQKDIPGYLERNRLLSMEDLIEF